MHKVYGHGDPHQCIHEAIEDLGSPLDVLDVAVITFVSPYCLQCVHCVHYEQSVGIAAEKICVYWETRQEEVAIVAVVEPHVHEV